MNNKNILFLGNFEAEFSSENYYRKTFEKLGHTVIPMQEGKATVGSFMDVMVNQKEKIDLFFWVHTHGWNTPNIDIFLYDLKVNKIPSVAYHLDLYMGIQRERNLLSDPFFTVDHFFTVDKLMADWLNNRSVHAMPLAQGHFLPAGVFEDDCFLGTPNKEKYPHEIIFTGSKGYHPEWPYRPKLIDWLHDTYGDRFGHYGGGGLPTVRGPELNNLYASAKVVVGDTLCKDFKYPYYSSDRLFEVTGRGGFLIYPKIEGIRDFFGGKELVIYDYNDFEGLHYSINFCLRNEDFREAIRSACHLRAKNEHTYTHRLQTLLGTVELHRK